MLYTLLLRGLPEFRKMQAPTFIRRFFVYEVTSTKFTRELVKEILISLVASVFMGLGTMFLLLWVGIYV